MQFRSSYWPGSRTLVNALRRRQGSSLLRHYLSNSLVSHPGTVSGSIAGVMKTVCMRTASCRPKRLLLKPVCQPAGTVRSTTIVCLMTAMTLKATHRARSQTVGPRCTYKQTMSHDWWVEATRRDESTAAAAAWVHVTLSRIRIVCGQAYCNASMSVICDAKDYLPIYLLT